MRVTLGFCGLLLVGSLSNQALAWQDLTEDCVLNHVKLIQDPKTSTETRQATTWFLVYVHRAAVYPLTQVAKKHPELAWTAVHLLDLIRTDNSVVKTFSQFLDAPPDGLKSTGEAQGFLSSRLEDMVGRKFKDEKERRDWVKENADYLAYDPARFHFVLDQEAKNKKQIMLHYPFAPSDHLDLDLAYGRLILALHLGQQEALKTMVGPEVQIVRKGGKIDTTPELDLDAFADPPINHRAILFRDEGAGRWLVRSNDAYFFFEGSGAKLLCVKAGLKPVE
jgi:hypothetical protein